MTIRLLVVFLLSCAFFSPAPSGALGSASTLAISHLTGTVCAVLQSNRTVKCARGSESFTVLPTNAPFTSVSAGREFFCGLRSGPSSTPLFCWSPLLASAAIRPKRIYPGQPPLEDLTVGEDHVAAALRGAGGGGVSWWRDGGRFPPVPAGKYRSLASGNGFTCGIDGSNHVRCWGTGKAQGIEQGFANVSMNTVEAGDSHACGITGQGALRCVNESGSVVDAPVRPAPFEFSSLALGKTHTCALRNANGSVVCWRGGAPGVFRPAANRSFALIVAGGDLTCGIDNRDLSVLCWSLPSSPRVSVNVQTMDSLGPALPGVCRSRKSCRGGEFPGSGARCGGGDEVICSAGGFNRLPPDPLAPSPSPQPPSPRSRRSKGLLAFAIVGAVGCFVGLLSVAYCLWVLCKKKKKVHNIVQPANSQQPRMAAALSAPRAPTGGNRLHKSRSSSTTLSGSSAKSFKSRFRRQGSRVMRRQRSGPSSASEYVEGNVKPFSFEELSVATKCFALDAKIGSGSFGKVYRGRLPDGREVAIKRREQPSPGKERELVQDKEVEFQSELSFLSRLHHKHLVGLVGFCEEGDERLLVYEYMKNGSLHDHLHPRPNGRDTHLGKEHAGGPLGSWKMRIKVLLDASRGIDYLHNYAVPPIIHRDIKSSNILLDATWTAKVSDFGFSLSESEPGVVLVPAKKAGTVGYMDPEYYGLHNLTVKSDVYGFGVVMLEVLTGKRAIFKDAEEDNLVNVADYASEWIDRGEVSRVLDPRMPTPGPLEAEAVERVAYTAMLCVNLEAKDRPTMTEVVANLEIALSLCEERRRNLSSASNSSID